MHIGHIGLYVIDFEKMLAFYQAAFGLVVTDIDRNERRSIVFMTSDPSSHHQIVLASGRPADSVSAHILNQLSLRVDRLDQLQTIYRNLIGAGANDLEPITHGTAWSVYFRDPEGNRLEVYVDTPWYITQPHRTPIDLTLPTEEIYAFTEALCRRDPSFRPMADWQASTGELLPSA